MSNYLGTYDPKSVVINVYGRDAYGFSDGSMVTVSRTSEFFQNKVGTRGEVGRARSADDTGTITMRFQHISPFLSYLQSIALAENNDGVPPVGVIIISDPSSDIDYVATECWIQNIGDVELGNEVSDVEVTFFAVNVLSKANGNTITSSNVLGL